MASLADLAGKYANANGGTLAELGSGRELTYRDLYQYIRRTPELSQQYTPFQNLSSPPNPNNDPRLGQIMGEAGAVVDPFAVMAIKRLLGMEMGGNELVNESHGLARRQQYLGGGFGDKRR